MKTKNKTNTNSVIDSFSAGDNEFENKIFKITDKHMIGTQILKMEITNSSETAISDLIEFIHNDFNGYSVWEMIKDQIGVYGGLVNGKWHRNSDGNFECIVEFFGSLSGKEKILFNLEWFKGVNIDFYFDTRGTLGHSSYTWETDTQSDIITSNSDYFVERARYFTDKDYLTVNHLEHYETFRDFISNPELFSQIAEPGFLQTGTEYVLKHHFGGGAYIAQRKNIQTLMHKPDYTVVEFDRSHQKMINLNTVIRPLLNQKRYKEEYKYHNCIESWVRALKNVETRAPYNAMQVVN